MLALLTTGCGPAPGAIDVRRYPADQQSNYHLFEDRCSRCHGLERATDRQIAAGGWARYVEKMSKHPGAGISEADQRRIASFLEYHGARRAHATEVTP